MPVPRTTALKVRAILGSDHDGQTLLTPYIETAAAITTRVAACATRKGLSLSSAELELIERWLAAWSYTKSDPVYQSKTTAEASATFVRGKVEPEPYKDMALSLDTSGCLNAILNRQRASVHWLGKPPSEQIDYEDRD